jgi:cell shape-determining protein MreD
MNTAYYRHILRALLILLLQVLVLKRIGLGSSSIWQYGDIFIYPVIVLLLPFRLSRHYVIIIGFLLGLIIDMFYDTIGVHAFALTATAYARGLLLSYLEPRGGYQLSMSPTIFSMGLNWVVTFTSLSLLIHTFLYFTAEVFTFVFIGKILLKTLITLVLSMLVVMGYHLLFNPRT